MAWSFNPAPAGTAPAAPAAPAQHPVPPPTQPAVASPLVAPAPPATGLPSLPAPAPAAALVAPAAPTTPPAGIPVPPETPKRRRGPNKATAAAAPPAAPAAAVPPAAPGVAVQQTIPVPAPTPPAVAAQVVAPPPAAAPPAVVAQGGSALAMSPNSFLGAMFAQAQSSSNSALGRLAQKLFGNGGGEPNLIPTIVVNEVGMFDCDQMNVEGSDADLPTGRDPFCGIYLGYRLKVVCWGQAYDRNNKNNDPPLWQAVIGADNPDLYDLAGQALADYQFTGKDRRAQLFTAHPRGALEILWWEPQAKFMVVRTQQLITAMNDTMRNLIAALPRVKDASGVETPVLQPFPAAVCPADAVKQNSKGGNAWEEYPLQITQQVTGDGAVAAEAFQAWVNGGGYTEEVDATLKEWAKTTINQEQVNDLAGVVAAKKGAGRG